MTDSTKDGGDNFPIEFSRATFGTEFAAFKHESGESSRRWLPETMSGGGGFIDFDSDGDDDILLVQGGYVWEPGENSEIVVFENIDGTYSRKSNVDGLTNLPGYGFGIYAGDLDNDGDKDLLYTTLGENTLLRNTGGRFENWSPGAMSDKSQWSTAAAFFDADNDGWLDILIGNYAAWTPETDIFCSADGGSKGYCTPELYNGQNGVFYRGTGGGNYIDATSSTGFASMTGKTLGISVADIDGDNYLDIIVANDSAPDQLFMNAGDGSFVDSGVSSGLAFDERGRARAGMGIDAAVVDSTGEITVFVGNFADQMIGVYRHVGNAAFLDRAATSRIGRASLLTLAFGLFVADLNLDGNQDVFVANGHIEPRVGAVRDNVYYRQAPHLFLGDGSGVFEDAIPGNMDDVFGLMVARSASYSDYDGDGDVDILVIENNGPAHLFRNEVDGSSIRVHLEGTQSNRDGVGARADLFAGGIRQVQFVRSGSSYLSNSEKTLTFGLGASTIADSVVIRWPSGIIDRISDIRSGRYLLKESSGVLLTY